MAYNFMCETAKEPNWKKLNKLLIKYDKLETFPIFELESNKFGFHTDEKYWRKCI